MTTIELASTGTPSKKRVAKPHSGGSTTHKTGVQAPGPNRVLPTAHTGAQHQGDSSPNQAAAAFGRARNGSAAHTRACAQCTGARRAQGPMSL